MRLVDSPPGTPFEPPATTPEFEVVAKPVWSFGAGLYLRIGDDTFTLEPESIYGRGATPGRIRAARRRVREFEHALAAAQADAGSA